MKRQLHSPALFFLVVLLLLAVSAARAAGGDAGAQAVGGAASPLNNVSVDFERVVDTPQGLQSAALQALADDASGALRHDHYTATVLEISGEWAHLLLIPTTVLDSNWQLPLAPADPIDIVAALQPDGAWHAVVKSEQTLPYLQSAVPGDFMDLNPVQPQEAFLFPWTAGQYWRVSQTWHSSAIDFFPLSYSNPAVNGAILAMGSGTLSQVCNDGEQVHLRVNHGDVTSGYLHLDAATVRAHDLNQIIPRGRFLGLIYDGEAFFNPNAYCRGASNLQFSTPCGCGTGPHLHFSASNTGITVEGYNLYNVGATRNTTYLSSNVRDEGPPPPAPEVVTVVNVPSLTPAYTPQCGSGWKQIDGYNGANAYVTLNTNQTAQSTNRADWTPSLPLTARYQVSAYIPNHSAIYWDCGSVDRSIPADTSDARYEITHATGSTTVTANQGPIAGDWLPLGTFRFQHGVNARVRLTDLNDEDNLSRTVSFSAMRFTLLPPDTPSALTASNAAYLDRVQLNWDAADGAAGYEIYRTLPGSAAPVRIATSAVPSYADTVAAPGVVYQYTVRAVNPAGASSFSSAVSGARHTAHQFFLPALGR